MKKRGLFTAALAALLLFTKPSAVYASEDAEATATSLYSQYAYVYDPATEQVLLDKASEERMYPASLTKMMTAMVVLDNNPDLSATVTITDEMLAGLYEANASVVGYTTGASPTVLDLLYGTILPSGADAVNALAFYTAGSIDAFVNLMNEKAAELGMTGTHFVNPTGLHDDNHYSTCRDMAVLLEYALQNETFRTVFETETYTDTTGITMEATVLPYTNTNHINMPGFLGDKTGYTLEAGHCMASYSELNGMNVIIITAQGMTGMYEPSHVYDASTILTWLSDNYGRKVVLENNTELDTFTAFEVIGEKDVTVYSTKEVSLDVRNDAEITITNDIPDQFDVTNEKQVESATISILSNDEEIYSYQEQYTVPSSDDFFNKILIFLRDLF